MEYLDTKQAIQYLLEEHGFKISSSAFGRHCNEPLKLKSTKRSHKRIFTKENLDTYYKYLNVNRINTRAEIIAFANHKGGVGKTLSVLNIATAFTKFKKHKILIIDFDPQANLSSSYDINLEDIYTIDDVIMNDVDIKDAIIEIDPHTDFIPSYQDLCDFDLNLATNTNINNLSDAIESIINNYDFIFIDCPPQISNLTYSAMVASDNLFIPMRPDMYSVDGLHTFMEYAKKFNENINIQGMFITQFSVSQVLDLDYKERLEETYPKLLMKTVIRKNIALAESVIYKKSIFDYKKNCSGYSDYKLLANEIYKRLGY